MEIIVWIAFLVIYSIFQALGDKKKKRNKSPMPEMPGEEIERPATLQDALREIQEALREAQNPTPEPPLPTLPEPKPEPARLPRPQLVKREPEFHSMESTISETNLEAETTYRSTFSERVLESKSTYEDVFPTSTFSDDNFSHAHPDLSESLPIRKQNKDKTLNALQASLRDRKSIQQAYILSEVLGKPLSLRR